MKEIDTLHIFWDQCENTCIHLCLQCVCEFAIVFGMQNKHLFTHASFTSTANGCNA